MTARTRLAAKAVDAAVLPLAWALYGAAAAIGWWREHREREYADLSPPEPHGGIDLIDKEFAAFFEAVTGRDPDEGEW